MSEQSPTIDLAEVIAAVRRATLEEAARVAESEMAVGNDLLDGEIGRNEAAHQIALTLRTRAKAAKP